MVMLRYLARVAEQHGAEVGLPEGPLSPRGIAQAHALADRLSQVGLQGIFYAPLARGEQTAEIVAAALGVPAEPSALLLDCVPSAAHPEMPTSYESFYGGVSAAQLEAGAAQMADAAAEFLSPRREKRILLLTHNPVIGWLITHAMGAPDWRWLTLNQAHAALSILAQRPGRPWTLVSHNDMSHLTGDLRTGLPDWYGLDLEAAPVR